MIEPFKYVIHAVAVERDAETGRIVREVPAQPLTVYSIEQALAALQEFENALQSGNVIREATPCQ